MLCVVRRLVLLESRRYHHYCRGTGLAQCELKRRFAGPEQFKAQANALASALASAPHGDPPVSALYTSLTSRKLFRMPFRPGLFAVIFKMMLLSLLSLLSLGAAAQADTFPFQPIRLIASTP